MGGLPVARIVGGLGRGAEDDIGGRYVAPRIRARLLRAPSNSTINSVAFALAVTLILALTVTSLSMGAKILIGVGAAFYMALGMAGLRAARRRGLRHVRLLQHGVLVTAQLVHRDGEALLTYEYTDGASRRVHVAAGMGPLLQTSVLMIYDPDEPTDPEIVSEEFPLLVIESDCVRDIDDSNHRALPSIARRKAR